jgi:hypothetical protein
MLAEKRMLDLDVIESQSVVELPERTLPLVTVVITNVLNNLTVEIDVRNVDIAAQICAAVLASDTFLTCEIQQ